MEEQTVKDLLLSLKASIELLQNKHLSLEERGAVYSAIQYYEIAKAKFLIEGGSIG